MMRRGEFLKEPLLHFLVIGAALFGAYAWLNRDGNNASAPELRLAESDVRWLKETFAQERQREPTEAELRGLVRDFVKEELFARQARVLGLDKDDIVVRRRLAQKMTFLLQDNSRRAEPSDDDLHRLYEAQRSEVAGGKAGSNQAQTSPAQAAPQTLFTRPRISFTHIFFSRDQRADAAADARQALRQLSSSDATAPTGALGDPVSIKAEFPNADERAVANQFGAKFAAKVFALEPGAWQGPIESSQGLHLVRISERMPAQLRPFDEIRGVLVEMWHAQSQRENEERYFVEVLQKYRLVPDASVKALVDPLLDAQAASARGVAPEGTPP
jgi:parvulin-like peptidyl-prolyl isomerase